RGERNRPMSREPRRDTDVRQRDQYTQEPDTKVQGNTFADGEANRSCGNTCQYAPFKRSAERRRQHQREQHVIPELGSKAPQGAIRTEGRCHNFLEEEKAS